MISYAKFDSIADSGDSSSNSQEKTLIDNKCNEIITHIDEHTETDAEFHEAFTKEVFRHFGWFYLDKEYNCVKKKTKPFGSNPRIIQRNKDIQEEYYKLREEQGYTAKKAKEMLAEKYELAFSTIISIVKKNINELVKR